MSNTLTTCCCFEVMVSRVSFRIRIRVGNPIPENGYRCDACTTTDGKNEYGLLVPYTQIRIKLLLCHVTSQQPGLELVADLCNSMDMRSIKGRGKLW